MSICSFSKTVSPRFQWLSVLLALLFGACSPESSAQVIALHSSWTLIQDDADDPFNDREVAEANCPLSSYGSESTIFEIETGTCQYATFRQDMVAPVFERDSLQYLVWHLNLWDETEGQAHIAIQLEDWLAWERRLDIPASAEIYDGQVEVPYDITSGVAYLHLHNHGVNNWRVADITSTGN